MRQDRVVAVKNHCASKNASTKSCTISKLGNAPLLTTAFAKYCSVVFYTFARRAGRFKKHIVKDSSCILHLIKRKSPNRITLGRSTSLSDKCFNSTTLRVYV